ncbi:hypothetical protein [uncultured Vibrio sp.]|uniref:hypothetical protein n=1 Tax=uncultured Vibrio sp. TaxID=114054 RepID=UPI0025E36B7D|nr:hypothetical protein [uncultured Vibrio sp.]
MKTALIEQRKIFDIVQAINVLAIANVDVIHIRTRFSAHVNCFNVEVQSANQSYDYESEHVYLMEEKRAYLDEEEALEELLSIESKVTELVIEAREEAETKVEVIS